MITRIPEANSLDGLCNQIPQVWSMVNEIAHREGWSTPFKVNVDAWGNCRTTGHNSRWCNIWIAEFRLHFNGPDWQTALDKVEAEIFRRSEIVAAEECVAELHATF